VHVDGSDLPKFVTVQEVDGIRDLAGRTGLMTNLNSVLSGVAVSGAHALGMVDRKRHGLFLVDVLARAERIDEMLAMQMLGRSDQDGVYRFVVEQAAMVEIGGGVGSDLFGGFKTAGIDVGEGDQVDVVALGGLASDLRAAVADADDAEADTLVSSEDTAGRGQRGREAGGHSTDKLAA